MKSNENLHLSFIPMNDQWDKLSKYRQQMIEYYAQELIKYGEFGDPKKALKASYMQVSQHIPDNLNTKHQYLFDLHLTSKNQTIGYLWYDHEPKSKEACLMYIFIFDEWRRFGWGRETMRQYENMLCKKNIYHSVLYVFIKNTPALNLYLSEGYYIDKRIQMFEAKSFTRYRMSKSLL